MPSSRLLLPKMYKSNTPKTLPSNSPNKLPCGRSGGSAKPSTCLRVKEAGEAVARWGSSFRARPPRRASQRSLNGLCFVSNAGAHVGVGVGGCAGRPLQPHRPAAPAAHVTITIKASAAGTGSIAPAAMALCLGARAKPACPVAGGLDGSESLFCRRKQWGVVQGRRNQRVRCLLRGA